MLKFICKINIGALTQTAYINNGKETLSKHSLTLKDIPDFIANYENLTEAYLAGPKIFTKKIGKETNQKELTKYSKEKTIFYYI